MHAGQLQAADQPGTIHIRVGTAGLDHLSHWASPDLPGWSAFRDLSYGYGRLALSRTGLHFEFVRTGERARAGLRRHRPMQLGVADTLALPLLASSHGRLRQRYALWLAARTVVLRLIVSCHRAASL